MSERENLNRLVRDLDPGAQLLRTRRLRGGLGSSMNVLHLRSASGGHRNVILRRYVAGWHKSTPERAHFEWRVLELVESAGIPAPHGLLLDAEGAYFDTPAMVLTYIPGRSFFAPADVGIWAAQLAAGLAAVHRVTPDAYDLSFLPGLPSDDIRAEKEERRVQLAEMGPLAQEAFAALESRSASVICSAPCLIHDDYWPGNTVWFRGRLAAIIDWTDAKLGDPRADVAQCRADLVLSHGLDVADAFLAAYERSSPGLGDVTFFDLLRGLRALVYYKHWLKGYHDAGLTHLDWQGAEQRLSDFVRRALAAV